LNKKEKEALRKVLRPDCFGRKELLECLTKSCDHFTACKQLYSDTEWLRQAFVVKARHEQMVKYYKRRIKLVRARSRAGLSIK